VIVLSWLTLGEVPGLVAIGGGAICLVGVALTRRRAGALSRVGD
jgi:drug/metabolite transporter (DMT)-like permease